MKAHPLIEAAVVEWLQIPRGSKGQLVVQLTQQTGLHEQTVRRQLATLKPGMRTRKRRSDAGKSSVSSDEARMVAAIIEESRRNTGTGQLPMEDALQVARANGLIKAERIDKATGEWVPVSASTMRKELRKHYVHSAQLAASSPAARLSSPHPNYLWQVDASISSQYYLDNDGLKPMPAGEFYPGKPQNMERISKQRLWRYVITDHASGCVEVFYVLGSESAGNLSAALIHAMTRRPNGTMHGVPQRLMADPGSATKSHTTSNLCNALGIKLIVNRVGNARAKGQVENAHYLVETHFEARLALGPKIKTLEEINILAQQWAQAYNATRIHTRTRMTRRAGWLRIESAHLVEAPSIDVLRQLTNSAPKPCVVKDGLIQFRSKTYSVRDIPELLNGARVMVAVNALDAAGSVRIMMQVNGVDTHYIAPCVERDSFGFRSPRR